MLERASQLIAKRRFLLIVGALFSVSAFGNSINLVIKDQHGQVLPNAVVEIKHLPSSKVQSNLPTAVMDQVDKQFSPQLLIVRQGQYVNFPNSDDIRHHVYSFSKAKPFQLKLYSGQPEEPIKFDNQGVVVLGCNIHDSMVGYIYVANSDQVYTSDEQGRIELQTDTFPVQASVWHSLQTAPLDNKKLFDIESTNPLSITINTSTPAPRNTFGSKFREGNGQ
ncbi:methylamine utilization protein [Pseudoalteromonas sp.]|uniref:methylamine utilization protein n=1 Tax=Pseudoalteromonas sp. TaxID=53249 RepID=UPI001BCCD833|nr:methylamine utilization protein [Pseudoalteromonas sp.]